MEESEIPKGKYSFDEHERTVFVDQIEENGPMFDVVYINENIHYSRVLPICKVITEALNLTQKHGPLSSIVERMEKAEARVKELESKQAASEKYTDGLMRSYKAGGN